MISEIEKRIKEASSFKSKDPKEIEKFRLKFLGKKGHISYFFSEFKKVKESDKKSYGLAINELKKITIAKLEESKIKEISNGKTNSKFEDLTRPVSTFELGSRHPISIIRDKIIDIFYKIGFNISEGPEIEDDWHNFTALNLPEHHPARDMQDTFFINKDPKP